MTANTQNGRILEDLQAKQVATLQQQLAEMQKKLDAANAKAAQKNTISFKVTTEITASGKPGKPGLISVYGLHTRFPVTLYASQWERLFARIPDLKAFIAANEATIVRREKVETE